MDSNTQLQVLLITDEQLAIHEYRHSVQINKMNRGFTRALYYIFGEQATGGILCQQ